MRTDLEQAANDYWKRHYSIDDEDFWDFGVDYLICCARGEYDFEFGDKVWDDENDREIWDKYGFDFSWVSKEEIEQRWKEFKEEGWNLFDVAQFWREKN